jgi:hypothetical protein
MHPGAQRARPRSKRKELVRGDAARTTLRWSGNLLLQAALLGLRLAYVIIAADGRPHMYINGEEVLHSAALDMESAKDVLSKEMGRRFGGQRAA